MPRSTSELEKVFGAESKGDTEEARAASSHKIFVRSQVQLGEDNERATGHKISALEAFRSYGWDVLAKVAEEGVAPLITHQDEPASTLKARRDALNLTQQHVARSASVSTSVIEQAETPRQVSRIRDLEKIAQALALNERLLGFVQGAGGDDNLGVRLREISQFNDTRRFSPTDVSTLAEAAWVISTQSDLSRVLGEQDQQSLRRRFRHDPDYNYPTYKKRLCASC
jgi:transcriptional regulator with XRE-family HTH domain